MAPSVRWYTRTTEGPDGEPVPRPSTEAEREKKPPAHILSGTDLVNELRLDPERIVDLVRFTNLQNYHSNAWMDLPPTNKYNTFTNMELQSALAFYTGERIPLLFSQVVATASLRTLWTFLVTTSSSARPEEAPREDMTVSSLSCKGC
jgi:hypothetical protein